MEHESLKELRTLIGIGSYQERKRALVEWERRWISQVSVQHMIEDTGETETGQLLSELASERARRVIGESFEREEIDVSVHPSRFWGKKEVRAEAVILLRRRRYDEPE